MMWYHKHVLVLLICDLEIRGLLRIFAEVELRIPAVRMRVMVHSTCVDHQNQIRDFYDIIHV